MLKERPLKRPFLIVLIVGFYFFIATSEIKAVEKVSPPDRYSEYVEYLVEQAKKKKLHQDRYWYILLHYKKGVLGTKSYIDTPGFFLSEDGKTSPWAELEATIRAFFDRNIPPENNMTERYIARYTWIKEKLKLDESKLPYPPSRKHVETIKKIDVKSLSLVFPAGYINNPASMYGHTFLIIERRNKSRLLAFSVNYQAHATESRGIIYAFKGLVGLYRGYFDIIPYYDKVEEYSDMDKREIWEYPLKFSEEEIERMLLHLFEMNRTYSNYFYLDENCSFNLLFLLEAAKPSLRLFDRLGPTVTPIDTLKAVVEAGAVTSPRYRPSKTSKIMHFEKQTDPTHLQMIKNIVYGKGKPEDVLGLDETNDTKILISDLLCEFIDYSYTEKEIEKKTYINMYRRALRVRSSLGNRKQKYEPIDVPSFPERSHDSYFLSSQYMYRNEAGLYKSYVLLNFRFTYHSLIDAEDGFNKGSQIIFGDFSLRYGITDNKFVLNRADIINLVSVVPRSGLIFPLSWKMKTGFLQRLGNDGNEHLVYNGSMGGGFSWDIPVLGLFYIMGEVDLDLGPSRKYWINGSVNFAMGAINRISRWFKIYYSSRAGYFSIGNRTLYLNARADNNFIISRNVSVVASYDFVRMYGKILHGVTVSGNYYF